MKEWTKNIRRVVPYVPGEQPKQRNIIKLNTNENPYDPSPRVFDSMDRIEGLRLYPDTGAQPLTNTIAQYYGVNEDQVFVGVGSDDVLAIAFMTFFNSQNPIYFPDITYSFYDVWAELFQIPYEKQPLDKDFNIQKEDYYKTNGGVIFPNPNAPTGILVSLEFIRDILDHNQDVVVIIDEAYIDFGGISAIELTNEYENLLVVQTFSKSRSMAGMRIGYAIGHKDLIAALQAVKYSFNSYTMNQAAITLGVASILDKEYFEEVIGKIIATRTSFSKAMRELSFEFSESSANFIFVKHNTFKAKDIFEAAKANHIYLRYFDKPRIDDYLRITIGTDEEMDKLIVFLKEYIDSHK